MREKQFMTLACSYLPKGGWVEHQENSKYPSAAYFEMSKRSLLNKKLELGKDALPKYVNFSFSTQAVKIITIFVKL